MLLTLNTIWNAFLEGISQFFLNFFGGTYNQKNLREVAEPKLESILDEDTTNPIFDEQIEAVATIDKEKHITDLENKLKGYSWKDISSKLFSRTEVSPGKWMSLADFILNHEQGRELANIQLQNASELFGDRNYKHLINDRSIIDDILNLEKVNQSGLDHFLQDVINFARNSKAINSFLSDLAQALSLREELIMVWKEFSKLLLKSPEGIKGTLLGAIDCFYSKDRDLQRMPTQHELEIISILMTKANLNRLMEKKDKFIELNTILCRLNISIADIPVKDLDVFVKGLDITNGFIEGQVEIDKLKKCIEDCSAWSNLNEILNALFDPIGSKYSNIRLIDVISKPNDKEIVERFKFLDLQFEYRKSVKAEKILTLSELSPDRISELLGKLSELDVCYKKHGIQYDRYDEYLLSRVDEISRATNSLVDFFRWYSKQELHQRNLNQQVSELKPENFWSEIYKEFSTANFVQSCACMFEHKEITISVSDLSNCCEAIKRILNYCDKNGGVEKTFTQILNTQKDMQLELFGMISFYDVEIVHRTPRVCIEFNDQQIDKIKNAVIYYQNKSIELNIIKSELERLESEFIEKNKFCLQCISDGYIEEACKVFAEIKAIEKNINETGLKQAEILKSRGENISTCDHRLTLITTVGEILKGKMKKEQELFDRSMKSCIGHVKLKEFDKAGEQLEDMKNVLKELGVFQFNLGIQSELSSNEDTISDFDRKRTDLVTLVESYLIKFVESERLKNYFEKAKDRYTNYIRELDIKNAQYELEEMRGLAKGLDEIIGETTTLKQDSYPDGYQKVVEAFESIMATLLKASTTPKKNVFERVASAVTPTKSTLGNIAGKVANGTLSKIVGTNIKNSRDALTPGHPELP